MIFSGLKRESAKTYLDSLCKGEHPLFCVRVPFSQYSGGLSLLSLTLFLVT